MHQFIALELKAARKKANKRARAQGLAPPGSGSAPTKKRSSKDADEARAAAEAAQNKFAGFEDHTSGSRATLPCVKFGMFSVRCAMLPALGVLTASN
eukprot:1150796-Pelagomonas_calceolata.AAC.2